MIKHLYALMMLMISPAVFSAYDFIGTYHCTGYDPYLKVAYHGTVTIKQKNAVYDITMTYDTGEIYHATGGPYGDDLLSVVFQDKNNLKKVGLEQYRIDSHSNKMGGFWVYLGKDQLGTEVCEKASNYSAH